VGSSSTPLHALFSVCVTKVLVCRVCAHVCVCVCSCVCVRAAPCVCVLIKHPLLSGFSCQGAIEEVTQCHPTLVVTCHAPRGK